MRKVMSKEENGVKRIDRAQKDSLLYSSQEKATLLEKGLLEWLQSPSSLALFWSSACLRAHWRLKAHEKQRKHRTGREEKVVIAKAARDRSWWKQSTRINIGIAVFALCFPGVPNTVPVGNMTPLTPFLVPVSWDFYAAWLLVSHSRAEWLCRSLKTLLWQQLKGNHDSHFSSWAPQEVPRFQRGLQSKKGWGFLSHWDKGNDLDCQSLPWRILPWGHSYLLCRTQTEWASC